MEPNPDDAILKPIGMPISAEDLRKHTQITRGDLERALQDSSRRLKPFVNAKLYVRKL
jgi:hypothetical protein